jgi:hypothetical protein
MIKGEENEKRVSCQTNAGEIEGEMEDVQEAQNWQDLSTTHLIDLQLSVTVPVTSHSKSVGIMWMHFRHADMFVHNCVQMSQCVACEQLRCEVMERRSVLNAGCAAALHPPSAAEACNGWEVPRA